MSDQAPVTEDENTIFGIPEDASKEPLTPASTTADDNVIRSKPPLAALLKFPPNGQLVLGKASSLHINRRCLLVGRQAATCDIRISQKSLSRQHAVLYYTARTTKSSETATSYIHHQLWLLDLGTKSGTFVNSQRAPSKQPIELQSGDTVQWGKAEPLFTVEWDGGNRQVVPNDAAPSKTVEKDKQEGPILSSREQHQKEIEAMMASLEEAPTYTKYVPETEAASPSTRKNLPAQSAASQSQSNVNRQRVLMDKYKLPLSESTEPAEVDAAISSIVMDPSGARFALGGMDSSLRLYDFGGYNASQPTPFANNYVQEGYPIRSLSYSPSGDRCVAATGSSQPYLLNREGEEVLQFVRGDVYVTDPQKTSGHTASITSVRWHPMEKSIVFSTSRDGSLRVWNVDKGKLAFGMLKSEDTVLIKGLTSGRKTIPTCLTVCPQNVALGTECGGIQIYSYPLVSKLRPQQSTVVGDGKDPIVSIEYSMDTAKLACRTEKAVYVYNSSKRLSSSSVPLLTCSNVGTLEGDNGGTSTMVFAPNGKTICIGVHDGGTSRIDIYTIPKETKSKPSVPIISVPLEESMATSSIVGLFWHVRLNQILVATSKAFQIWYSSVHSQKGILLTSGRRKKRQLEDDLQDFYQSKAPPPGSNVRYDEIEAPNALPLFGGDSHKLRKKQKQEKENSRQHPQQPGKSVYNTPNTIFAQMVVDGQGAGPTTIAGKDPRAALAQYSEGKSYISSAYEGNTERILAEKTVEEEEDAMKK